MLMSACVCLRYRSIVYSRGPAVLSLSPLALVRRITLPMTGWLCRRITRDSFRDAGALAMNAKDCVTSTVIQRDPPVSVNKFTYLSTASVCGLLGCTMCLKILLGVFICIT